MRIIFLFSICLAFIACKDDVLIKPKAMLSLSYKKPDYKKTKLDCPFQFEKNSNATLYANEKCEVKIIYPENKATVFLTYRETTPEKLSSYIKEAKAYFKGSASEKNLPFESMRGLFNGSKKMFIHINGEREITDAVNFCISEGITMVIVHGKEADKVAPLLVEHKIPVVLDRTHRLPDTEDEDYDLPFRMAKILTDKGIMVGMGMEGNMERMSTRNLPFYAGTCVAYGLSKEEALQIITSNNAKILGIDNHLGSITVGKDATLFISEGDALDMRTNKINTAFISGRKISLETHQTKLWKRYSNKYKAK